MCLDVQDSEMILGKSVVTGKLLFSLYESSYYVPGIHAGL